jgi:hypothetical protein
MGRKNNEQALFDCQYTITHLDQVSSKKGYYDVSTQKTACCR